MSRLSFVDSRQQWLPSSDSDFQLVANLQATTGDRPRLKFEDAVRGKMWSCQTERAEVLNQPDNPQFSVEKDRVDRIEHPEGMNALARSQPEARTRREATGKHQSPQPGQKSIRQPHIGRHNLTRRLKNDASLSPPRMSLAPTPGWRLRHPSHRRAHASVGARQ